MTAAAEDADDADDNDNNPPTPAAVEENSRVWLSTDFWEFIDLLLRDIRKEARTTERTPMGREKHMEA